MPFESLNAVLIEIVRRLGGSKVVGVQIWPSKGVEAAQRHLLACLNLERPEKLSPEELLHLLRLARKRGCHIGMSFIAADLSYSEPTPVEPKDEADDLRRQVLEMGKQLQGALARIEQLDKAAPAASSLKVVGS